MRKTKSDAAMEPKSATAKTDHVRDARIKFGILPAPQFTKWDALLELATLADESGMDHIWMSDHLMPAYGDVKGPCFESLAVLAAWAVATKRINLGSMVLANGFRNPALTAKAFSTLDHISGGRAMLGIGAGWFEQEHAAYGFDFGSSVGTRLDRLEEALIIIQAMLQDQQPNEAVHLAYYHPTSLTARPLPIRNKLPILIGGGGMKKTLRLVATFADIWNTAGSLELVQKQVEALGNWCVAVGRDPSEIEWNYHVGPIAIRSSVAEGRRMIEDQLTQMSAWAPPDAGVVGPPERIAEHLTPFVELGFTSFYFDVFPPYDYRTVTSLVEGVRPLVRQMVRS